MKVHPNRKWVATGESAENPQIHIWDAQDCSPETIINTNHTVGIVNMAFSSCGDLLASVGIDKCFSLQVTKVKSGDIVAFKHTSPQPIIDLCINPNDKYEFATCGNHLVQIWAVYGKTIILKENIHIMIGDKNELPYITCLKYLYYRMQGEIQTDLVVGTNHGDLGLITKGKYIKIRETAHKKMINCIRVTDVLKNQVLIITAGEDDKICFWDSSFEKVGEFQLTSLQDIKSNKQLSAQSLDIFHRLPPMQAEGQEVIEVAYPNLLVGTRAGDVIQIELKPIYKKNKYGEDSQEPSEGYEEEDQLLRIEFNPKLLLRNHAVQKVGDKYDRIEFFNSKRIMFSIHPDKPFMATVGADKFLCLWDTFTSIIYQKIEVVTQPTCVKWNNDGTLLVVGLANGNLIIYQLSSPQMAAARKSYDPMRYASRGVFDCRNRKDTT